MIRAALLLGLLAAFPAATQGRYAVIETATVPLRSYVGDPVELRVRLHLAGASGALAAPKTLPSAPWMDVRQVRVTALGADEWDVRVQLVAFAPGLASVPALDLGAITLEGLSLQTTSILEEKKVDRPAAPRDQLLVPGTARRLAAAVALAIGGPLAAAWLAARLLRLARAAAARRRRALPWSRLQKTLRRLRARMARGDRPGGRELYIELTVALRAYLERRHGLAATTATTRELRERLAALALPSGGGEAAAGLARLLARGDWVKFGGADAEAGELAAAVDSAELCSRTLEEAAIGGP